jgi:cytochrome P450
LQGVCNLRADFGGVAHFLASHGYPSGIAAGEADPLAVQGVSSVDTTAAGGSADAASGMLAAANEFSGLLQHLFLSPKPLWRVALPWGSLARVAELREYMRSVARQALDARRASGGGSDAAVSPGAFTDLADILLAAEEVGAGDLLGAAPAEPFVAPTLDAPSVAGRRGEGKLSADEVVDDTVALMWAATETSGATLGWLV